ncbi:MAG: sigma-70 family RNA polymerase sigma factor [Lachnospiraceae bacterium]|nr:sigma-70 family RNA polymerase sigma factor [Lachnospiraceae bacterium]
MKDKEIIKLYLNRDEQAIKETDIKFGNYCTSIAKNILDNDEDVKECLNDTYLQTWNSIPPNKPKSLSLFIGKITRNLAFNKYKYEHTKKRGSGQIKLVLDELAECVSGKDNVEQEIDRMELVLAINKFLDSVSKEKRNIFICRYWYAFSITEISGRFEISEANVSVILSRLRSALKKYLEEMGFVI